MTFFLYSRTNSNFSVCPVFVQQNSDKPHHVYKEVNQLKKDYSFALLPSLSEVSTLEGNNLIGTKGPVKKIGILFVQKIAPTDWRAQSFFTEQNTRKNTCLPPSENGQIKKVSEGTIRGK